jgi:hypothetical protein
LKAFGLFNKKQPEPVLSRRFQLARPVVAPAFMLTGTLMELEIKAPANWLQDIADRLQLSLLQHPVPFLADQSTIMHWLQQVLIAINTSWPDSLQFAFVVAKQQLQPDQLDLKQLATLALELAALWPELESKRRQLVIAQANFHPVENIPLQDVEWQRCFQAVHRNANYLKNLSHQLAQRQQQVRDAALGTAKAMTPVWLEHREQIALCLDQLALLMDMYTTYRQKHLFGVNH